MEELILSSFHFNCAVYLKCLFFPYFYFPYSIHPYGEGISNDGLIKTCLNVCTPTVD